MLKALSGKTPPGILRRAEREPGKAVEPLQIGADWLYQMRHMVKIQVLVYVGVVRREKWNAQLSGGLETRVADSEFRHHMDDVRPERLKLLFDLCKNRERQTALRIKNRVNPFKSNHVGFICRRFAGIIRRENQEIDLMLGKISAQLGQRIGHAVDLRGKGVRKNGNFHMRFDTSQSSSMPYRAKGSHVRFSRVQRAACPARLHAASAPRISDSKLCGFD